MDVLPNYYTNILKVLENQNRKADMPNVNLTFFVFIIVVPIFDVFSSLSMRKVEKVSEKMLALSIKKRDERSIEVRLTNRSKHVLRLYSHVETGEERHYDNFNVILRTPDYEELHLSFYSDRLRSAPIIVELQPNENLIHTIDLVYWANHYTNSAQLKNIGLFHLSSIDLLKVKARYFNQPCKDCDEYHQAIWVGNCDSDWVE